MEQLKGLKNPKELRKPMRARAKIALPVILAVVALASLSCSAEEPASTATPIPPASAQEVVESACGHMEGVDSYDFMASVKAEQDGVPFPDALTVEASVSGKDFQISFTGGDGSTSEGIWVGNKGYTRSTAGGNVWEVSAAPSRTLSPNSASWEIPLSVQI